MNYQQLIDKFWQQYSTDIQAAQVIYNLFREGGEEVVNDHIALRTFSDPRVSVDVLALPFVKSGYVEKGQYDFPTKKLFAKHYEHPDGAPKIFISQLLTEQFSEWMQHFVSSLVDQIPQDIVNDPEKLLFSGRPWSPLSYQNYEKLLAESQYVAWMYAYGYCTNHFTVSINHLSKFHTVEEVNSFLKSHGFTLNSQGGEVKGSAADKLEQSSIMAERQVVEFSEGGHEIPSCYYEFALRYQNDDGQLYQGFVAASADKIFESTHNK